jgi:two-component system response regulator AtoC
MSKYNVLVVDDEEENLFSTRSLLQRWGYDVDALKSGVEAIEQIKTTAKQYAVILLDYKMPVKNGLETAREIRALNDEVSMLIYTAHPSLESAKASMRVGVADFIEKNEDLEYLKSSVDNACKKFESVRKLKPTLSESEAEKIISSIGMVGKSQKLAEVVAQAIKFRDSRKPVLILGETGVGKELIAKALHAGLKNKFFAINCATFENSSLVESELFGYEKGAFTGAMNRKIGIFEVAQGGTVFLDELHHLPIGAQAKLLRVLREKKVRRVGAQQEEDVDFRLLAACRPDIEERVTNGTFLPDLYYRLKFLRIEIPPLRERPEDVAPLVQFFCDKHQQETGETKSFLLRTLRVLEKYSWPGNVGELDGYISALLTNSTKGVIDLVELDRDLLDKSGFNVESGTYASLEARQDREKRQFLLNAIEATDSNIRHAAQRIGIKPTSLHTLMTRLGIRESVK